MDSTNDLIKAGEAVEDLQLSGLLFIKAEQGFQYGTDQVLLADFARARNNDTVCDLGAGSGILTLLLLGRADGLRVDALELDAEKADRMLRCALLNGVGDRVSVTQGDLRSIRSLLPDGRHTLVICNPPYHRAEEAGQMPDDERPARAEETCSFDDVCAAARWLLNNKGRFVTMCPASRLADMMLAMTSHGLTPKRLRLVQARQEKAPYLCLLEAMAGARPGMAIEPVLLLADAEGGSSDKYCSIDHSGVSA